MATEWYDKSIIENWRSYPLPAIVTFRRLPRPWPMFCGQSLSKRTIKIEFVRSDEPWPSKDQSKP
jgi:hypothetical protein